MAIWRVSVGEYERLYDISDDGRHILLGSYGISDIGEPGGEALLGYDFDTVTGDRQPILINLVSPLVGSSLYVLDADRDASVIAFAEQSGSLVPGDTNGTQDVFVLDRGTGALTNLTPSRDSDTDGLHLVPRAVSDDGSKLLLIVNGGGAGTFLLDRTTGGDLVRLSGVGNATSTYTFITDLSADGRVVLLPGEGRELVLRDLGDGSSTVLDRGFPTWASVSGDGRFAAFVSAEDGPVPGDAAVCWSHGTIARAAPTWTSTT